MANSTCRLSERLKKIRQDLGKTQAQFAEIIGISKEAVYKHEAGKSQISAEKIPSIAKALGVSTDYLLGLTDYPTPEAQYKGTHTGLSYTAIKNLSDMPEESRQTVDRVLSSIFASELFRAITDFLNTDYCIPVYASGFATLKDGILRTEYLPANEAPDVVKGIELQSCKIEDIYMLNLAKDANNPEDNRQYFISKQMLHGLALQSISEYLVMIANEKGR